MVMKKEVSEKNLEEASAEALPFSWEINLSGGSTLVPVAGPHVLGLESL